MRAWVAVVLFAFAGCSSASEPSPVPVGQAFEVKISETQSVGDGLRITFDRVTDDSRCPTDVTCVWAGDAAIRLTLSAPGAGSSSAVLHTSKADEPATIGSFEIRVRDLRPAPISTRTIDPGSYVATLVAFQSGR